MAATKQAAPQRPGIPADRQLHARRVAHLGCAAALGYGVLKLVWSLGGTIGLRHHERLHVAPAGFTGPGRLFDYWGTPILAGLAVVILLGLVYPWGNTPIVRPLLRALAWAGTLVTVAGVGGLILMIRFYAGDLSPDRLVDQAGHVAIQPATFVFVYICFLVLGVAFGVTAWLTRR